MSVPREAGGKYMASACHSSLLVAVMIPFRGVSKNLKICFKNVLKWNYCIPGT